MPDDAPTRRNADRFLDAFAMIERRLRELSGASRTATFHQLVFAAGARDPVVRHFADDLREYADLRNAIVHDRRDSLPLADPLPEIVLEVEDIQEKLYAPPNLAAGFEKPVVRCSVHDRLRVPLAAMRARDFSQVPAYDGPRFAGLLTFDATARWLAVQLEENAGPWEEPEVGDVLRHARADGVGVLPRGATVYEALQLFADAHARGKVLDAILVTEAGKPHERPLAIVTPYDIPALLASAGPRPRR